MAGTHDHAAAGRVPFWIHQLVELLLGMLLLVQGARTGEHTAVLVTLGALLLLLALCSEGALAAWPWIGRRLHRVLDLVAAGVLALSPLALGLDHMLPIVILEVAAAAMVWLALRTEWRTPVKRSRARSLTRSKAAPDPKASAPAAGSPNLAPPAPPSAPTAPPRPEVPLARKVGGAVGKARDDGPRQLGHLVGKAQRAAKAAMTPDPTPPTPPGPPVTSTPSEPPDRPSEPPIADPPT